MNTKDNARRKRSRQLIGNAFLELLQKKDISEMTVSEICNMTGLNRSTFYSNYEDIYDLADKLRAHLEEDVNEIYKGDIANSYGRTDFLRLLYHMKENSIFYKTYFKLGFDAAYKIDMSSIELASDMIPVENLEYHIEFFKAGFNAIVKKWLGEGCKIPPEDIAEILKSEYGGRR